MILRLLTLLRPRMRERRTGYYGEACLVRNGGTGRRRYFSGRRRGGLGDGGVGRLALRARRRAVFRTSGSPCGWRGLCAGGTPSGGGRGGGYETALGAYAGSRGPASRTAGSGPMEPARARQFADDRRGDGHRG